VRNLSESPARANRHAISVKPQPLPPRAGIIAECTITTDSVVATATVRTERTMRRIVMQWGDGTVNTLRNRPGVEAAVGHQNQLPPGTYRLNHAYEAPEDRKSFEQLVLIRVEDQSGGVDFCLNQITLTPRYKVTQYQIGLNQESGCDSLLESQNEFDIVLFVNGEPVAAWRWELSQSLTDGTVSVLPGSLISRELTVADGAVEVHLELTETDPIFDDELSLWSSFSALSNSNTMYGVMEGDGCKVGYSYDLEVKLIVPLPSYGQDVVMVANA
jgi:hypothetical protein